MIREPISPKAKLLLGICSICVVIGLYSWVSIRQHAINPRDTSIPNAGQFVNGFQKITHRDEDVIFLKSEDVIEGRFKAETSDSVDFEMITDSGEEVKTIAKQEIERIQYSNVPWLWQDIQATSFRLAVGVLIGVVLSFVVGVAMGCFAPVEAFLLPPVAFFSRIPAIAMLSVYMVVFGISEPMFFALVALGIFPTLTQAIFQAAQKDVSEHAVYKAYTLGASQFEVIGEVVVRQILPRVIESVRLQIGPAMVLLIASEMLLADVGFGYRIRIQQRLMNMSVVFIYLILLGGMGCLIERALYALRRQLCPWFGE